MLKNVTASMIVVWSLVILFIILGFVFDFKFSIIGMLIVGLYIGSVADAIE